MTRKIDWVLFIISLYIHVLFAERLKAMGRCIDEERKDVWLVFLYLDGGHWFAGVGDDSMKRDEPFYYPEILYNEAIHWLSEKWGRNLTPHEMHIAVEIYRFARMVEAENKITILEVVR